MTRGILIVHGIGSQHPGETLRDAVGPLVRYLESKGAKVDLDPEIAMGNALEVVLHVRGPDGRFAEEWRVREAYWATAFRPPTLGQMLRWGQALIDREVQAISRIFENPLNENPQDACEPYRLRAAPQPVPPSPPPPPYPARVRRSYLNQAFLYKAGALAIRKLGHGLLTLVWLLLLLRGLPGPPSAIKKLSLVARATFWLRSAVNALANGLTPFVVDGLGDAKAFIDDPIAADAIRRPVEQAVLDMLQDDAVQSVTIIAHSLGALVSYDAMTEGRPIDVYLRAHPDKRTMPGSGVFRRITWVTVGAALNRGFTISAQEPSWHAMERFRSPIAATLRGPGPEAFFWLNLYARYDPVPAGPTDSTFHRSTRVDCSQYKERMVINGDSLHSDHVTYWDNDALVWPRIVRAICDGEYPWQRVRLDDPEGQQLIREKTIAIADRSRRRMQLLGVWLLLGLLAVVVIGLVAALLFGALSLLWQAYRAVSWLAYRMVEGAITGLRRLITRP